MQRQWRVGTLSMGIILIALGCTLFISQFKGWSSLEILFKLWPIVLILLGVEILGYLFFSRKEMSAIKYDGFSIFMIMLIMFLSVGAYALKIFLDYAAANGHIFIR